ncbi:Potassium channel KAT1 [Zea mays]|uniref:Potassium channel KAT1 n=1 Tax=Zea mays TaxID=4577 RepID=A0A1D6GBD1_MAIZE|nr:Potassium channel KAT1 [Zea mays]AQL00394.1 Potassium channel KAT1 [Zea mays]
MTPFVVDLGFGEESILRGLTEANIAGRGGSGRVYRVTFTNRLNGAAGAVAVKQIRTARKLDGKLEREFESEAGILGNVRHNNIVRLLCCLSGAEAKLLVYDYMDNGSLDNWLHGDALAAGGHPMAMRVRSARRARLAGRPGSRWPSAPRRGCVTCTTNACRPSFTATSRRATSCWTRSSGPRSSTLALPGCWRRLGRQRPCPPWPARSATRLPLISSLLTFFLFDFGPCRLQERDC